MFTPFDITAVVVLPAAVTISALAQCSKKKSSTNPVPSANPKNDADKPERGSVVKAPQSSQAPTPPDGPGNTDKANKSDTPKSLKNLDKTQTQDQDGKTGEGNEGAPKGGEKSKDDEDTFEHHKPVSKEAKRAKEILSKPSIPKNRDDYKTFNKKNMPESDFDKTMSEVK